MSDTHNVINCEHGVPIRAWTRGVTIEPEAQTQLLNVAQLPLKQSRERYLMDVPITAAKAIEVPGTTSRLEMQKCGRP